MVVKPKDPVAVLLEKYTKEVKRRNSAYDYYGLDNTLGSLFPNEMALINEVIKLREQVVVLQKQIEELKSENK